MFTPCIALHASIVSHAVIQYFLSTASALEQNIKKRGKNNKALSAKKEQISVAFAVDWI